MCHPMSPCEHYGSLMCLLDFLDNYVALLHRGTRFFGCMLVHGQFGTFKVICGHKNLKNQLQE